CSASATVRILQGDLRAGNVRVLDRRLDLDAPVRHAVRAEGDELARTLDGGPGSGRAPGPLSPRHEARGKGREPRLLVVSYPVRRRAPDDDVAELAIPIDERAAPDRGGANAGRSFGARGRLAAEAPGRDHLRRPRLGGGRPIV